MPIANFPPQLVPAIQLGFLEQEFRDGLTSKLGYRAVADKTDFPGNIGQTITMTRDALKAPVTTPDDPTKNTNFDNGKTPRSWAVEQYTLSIDQYGDTIDLNMVTQMVGIASQFLKNARVNGIQAAQSIDRLARNALFFGARSGVGGYLGGNTRILEAASGSNTVHVDDISGFTSVLYEGQPTPIGGGVTAKVKIGSGEYTLTGFQADQQNKSSLTGASGFQGISGTLTLKENVSEADGKVNSPVVMTTAPLVIRPAGRQSTTELKDGDTLTMDCVLQAKAELESNNVPSIAGAYHCYLGPKHMLSLLRDPEFQLLYRGSGISTTVFRAGDVIELLGIRFIITTEAPVQRIAGLSPIHRALVVGAGALIEGDFADEGYTNLPDVDRELVHVVDSVCMVTREPLDRFKQIIAQSWYWIGGFALPTDMTADPTIIPTASNAYLKRGVVVESYGSDSPRTAPSGQAQPVN